MSTQIPNSFKIDWLRPRTKMQYMAGDTRDHIEKAFHTQAVFPFEEVYPGWFRENARRAAQNSGAWHSTGDAARNFYWQLKYAEDKNTGMPTEVKMEYFFNYYISFVDYGVGKGRPLSKVQRGKDARREERYTDWVPKQGKTHRPVFRKEMRALKKRGATWLTTWTGRLFMGYVFRGMEAITTNKGEGVQEGGFTFSNLQIQ